MARRCRLATCRLEIPKVKDSDWAQAKGFCSIDHMAAHGFARGKALVEKHRRAEASKERAEHRKAKKAFKDNDLPHQKELTRRVCNQMIRLLDRGKCCPTCDEPLIDGSYDAGHVRTVAAYPELRFDPRAIFGQCRKCNGSGTIRKRTRKTQEVVSGLYKAWVLRTLGQDYYDWLYGPHEARHYTCDDLRDLRAMFAAECRRLEAGQGPSRNWRELEIETRRVA